MFSTFDNGDGQVLTRLPSSEHPRNLAYGGDITFADIQKSHVKHNQCSMAMVLVRY